MKIKLTTLKWERSEDGKKMTAKSAVGEYTITAGHPSATLMFPIVLIMNCDDVASGFENVNQAKEAAFESYRYKVVTRINETVFGGNGIEGAVIADFE